MTYNLTSLNNVTGMYELVIAVNDYSNQILLIIILAMIFFVILVSGRTGERNFSRNIMNGGFITLIIATLVWGIGLVSFYVPLTLLTITLVGAILVFIGE